MEHVQNTECLYTACAYLKGSQAELNTEAEVNIEVIRQKIEKHVVCSKQRDEEQGGLSEASVTEK